MNLNFEFITNLQYKVKSLTNRVQALESGEKYTAMESEFKARLSAKDREIRRLKAELADAYRQRVTQRHEWWQVFDDTEKEHAKELAKKDREIKTFPARSGTKPI